MRKYWILVILLACFRGQAQELFVSTEPASNPPAGSMGVTLTSKLFQMNHDGLFEGYRISPGIMIGINKRLMIHIEGYGSNIFQHNFRVEGGSIYGKYRFFSKDAVHKHFRVAAFAKLALVKNPEVLETTHKHLIPDGNGGFIVHDLLVFSESDDLDLEGNTSGMTAGFVATKLINKLAASISFGYSKRINNIDYKSPSYQAKNALTYTASTGYLLFPGQLINYQQLNCNIYLEVLGSSLTDKHLYFIDMAPAVQFIIHSIARIDFCYQSQIAGNTNRLCNNLFLLRMEYNLLSVFGKK